MNAAHANLAELVQLAGERSSERRRELLRRVTDLFIDAPRDFDARQTGQISEIISILAREMDLEVRQNLAGRLAELNDAPRGLVLELANDEIAVARPILTNSLALTDTDLIGLAKLVSQDHLEAIARRAKISAPVSDHLAVRGGDRVLLELANNEGADLSRLTFEIMAARASVVEGLRKPLVTHGEIPPDLLNGLFFIVSTSLRRTILDRMQSLPPEIVEEAIRHSEEALRKRVLGEDDAAEAASPAVPLTEAPSEALLLLLSKQRRFRELTHALAGLAGLDQATAKRLLSDPDPVGIAVVSRACRFDRQTFATLVFARDPQRRSTGEAAELIKLYDHVPVNAAQRVMRFWRVRQSGEARAAA